MVKKMWDAWDFLYAYPDPGPFPGHVKQNLKGYDREKVYIVVKNIKEWAKVENNKGCANLLSGNYRKLQLFAISFYLLLFAADWFSLLYADLHNKCRFGSSRETEWGSMRIRIHRPQSDLLIFGLVTLWCLVVFLNRTVGWFSGMFGEWKLQLCSPLGIWLVVG